MCKNLKNFYKNNRVYSILMIISIMCIIAILLGVILYFVGQTNKNKYGDRLDGIEKVMISDNMLDEIENKIKENELVKEVNLNISGKLIYITISLTNGKHKDAEAIAQASLELFDEDKKTYYDIQYIIENLDDKETENFPIMGYIKAGNSVIKWTNYVTEGE